MSKQQRLCLNLVDDRIDLCWEISSLVSDQHMNICPTGFHVSKTVQVRTSVYQDSQNPGGTELSPYSKQEVSGQECYRWFLIFISFWGLQRLCSTKLGKLVLLQIRACFNWWSTVSAWLYFQPLQKLESQATLNSCWVLAAFLSASQ